MIDVRSAKTGHDLKKDLSSDFSKDIFLLAKHIRRSRLRAVAGSQELGVPLAEYAASLRFQTSASSPRKGETANLNDFRIRSTRPQGHSWGILVEPVGIEPTT
jgi:hypothetical protein